MGTMNRLTLERDAPDGSRPPARRRGSDDGATWHPRGTPPRVGVVPSSRALSPSPLETRPDITGNYERALANAEMGYVSVPCRPGTKVPLVKWKPLQTQAPTTEQYREWFLGTRNNIAILTTGLVVVDIDDITQAELALAHCGDTPCKLRTPRGGLHLLYRARAGVVVGNHVRVKGLPIDLRAENGLELQPCSRTELGAYEWLGEGLRPRSELPVARIGWTRRRVRRRARRLALPEGLPDSSEAVRRARAYLARVEGAVSGQGGHNATFRAACILAQRFALGFAEAWPLLLEWNERCSPPWSEPELRHKLDDALQKRA